MKLRPVRILSALTFGLALTLLFPAYAPGQPSNDIQAKAAKLENDLQAANSQVASLGQKLDEAQARVDEAEAKVKATQDEINRTKSALNERAAAIYKVAGGTGPLDAINAQNATDAAARAHYSDLAAAHDDSLMQQLAAAKADLDEARAEATAQRDLVAKAKADADAAAGQQQKLLDQVKGDIEQALRAQTAVRAASAPKVGGGAPLPVGSGGAGAAVAFANAQVGKPYCNTSDRFGPNCYDCSGLTHSSWQAGGLTIPTTSGAQGSAYPHVNISDLQPGDLITSSSWGAHVGIWVGGGYVHATNYRNNPNAVKFVGGSGSVVDAVRPS